LFPGISIDRAMALLDLKDKKDWADFASKECIVADSSGCIDAKETQVRLTICHVLPLCFFDVASYNCFLQQARLAKQAAIEASER
jgi:tellurite resistance protein